MPATAKRETKAPSGLRAKRLELYKRREWFEKTDTEMEDEHKYAKSRLERIQSLLLDTASERQEPANGPLRNLAAMIHEKRWNLFKKYAKNDDLSKWPPTITHPQIRRLWRYAGQRDLVTEEELKMHVRCLLEAPRHYEKLSGKFQKSWLAARKEGGLDRSIEKRLGEVQPIFIRIEGSMLKKSLALFGGPAAYASILAEKNSKAQDQQAWRRMEEHLGELACYTYFYPYLGAVDFINSQGDLQDFGDPRIKRPWASNHEREREVSRR